MRQKIFNEEKIQAGDLYFKKSRFKRVLHYIKYKYGADSPAPFPKRFQEYEELDPELHGYIERMLKEHTEDILGFYEVTYYFARCLRLVSLRPRSRKEIVDFLSDKVDNEASIRLLFERLEPFLNDEEFAEYLVQKERARNPKGNSVIRMKLKAKGVSEEIIENVLVDEGEGQVEYIRRQFEKKKDSILYKIKKKGSNNIKRDFTMHMKAYLYTKGFSSSDIDTFLQSLDYDEFL